jgi:hypothetical protein
VSHLTASGCPLIPPFLLLTALLAPSVSTAQDTGLIKFDQYRTLDEIGGYLEALGDQYPQVVRYQNTHGRHTPSRQDIQNQRRAQQSPRGLPIVQVPDPSRRQHAISDSGGRQFPEGPLLVRLRAAPPVDLE